jgi:hypothetical protein
MKKLIIVIIIIGALVVLYMVNRNSGAVVKSPTDTTSGVQTSKPNPANATFVLDDEEITLSNGKKITENDETNLLDLSAYGDINGDKKEDTAVLVTRSGGGSGLFIYVAAYVSNATSYKGTNGIYLGDRIVPESILINSSGVITVNYLDRSLDEPFAAEPTIAKSKQFVFKSGELVER